MGRFLIVIFILFSKIMYGDILKENFITFDLNSSKVLVDFESDNLIKFIDIDDNKNGIISWKELKNHKEEIEKLLLKHIKIRSDKHQCTTKSIDFSVYRRVHQSYIKIPVIFSCNKSEQNIYLKYDLFFDIDKDQKAFVKIKSNAKPVVLSKRVKEIPIHSKEKTGFESFKEFVIEGIWHIWIGYDHILFLLMLIIPSVYKTENRKRVAREHFLSIAKEILKIVTAFTVAHSITLALSASNLLKPDNNLIEVLIALSVLFTALNNIFLFTETKQWLIAGSFGFIHGFGFANVLSELISKKSDFVSMLFGFNLGVEIGQIIIVISILPILFILRKTTFYKKFILYTLSIVTVVISSLWAVERAFGLSILPM